MAFDYLIQHQQSEHFCPTVALNHSILASRYQWAERHLRQRMLGVAIAAQRRKILRLRNPHRMCMKTWLKRARHHLTTRMNLMQYNVNTIFKIGAPVIVVTLPHILTLTISVSLGKHRWALVVFLRRNSKGCTPATYFQAAIAFDKVMDTKGCPNRMFFPVSCRHPFHNCNRAPIRRICSPAWQGFGTYSGSKKKEALMVRLHSLECNVAATCMSEPWNHMSVSCTIKCE